MGFVLKFVVNEAKLMCFNPELINVVVGNCEPTLRQAGRGPLQQEIERLVRAIYQDLSLVNSSYKASLCSRLNIGKEFIKPFNGFDIRLFNLFPFTLS